MAVQVPRKAVSALLLLGSAVVLLALIPALYLGWTSLHLSSKQSVLQARLALESGDLERARSLSDAILGQFPDSNAALVIAGSAAAQLGERDRALEYYNRITLDGSIDAIVGLGAAGDLLVQSGRLSEAETRFLSILEMDAEHTLAHRRLAALYVAAGRRRASAIHHLELLQQHQIGVDELMLLGDMEQILFEPELLQNFRDSAPDDPLPLVGLARISLRNNDFSRALQFLRRASRIAPQDLEIQANLGKVLIEAGTAEEMERWHRELPPSADEHPDVWAVRGQLAHRRGESDVAIRCFWEAVRLDPNYWKANYHLAQALVARGDLSRAQAFHDRAEKLNALVDVLISMYARGERPAFMLRAAELTESLGRLWEAWAWYDAVAQQRPDLESARRERDRLRRQLTADLPRTLPSANPAHAVDLSSFPPPRWHEPRHETDGSRENTKEAQGNSEVAFANVAGSAGLDFVYRSGDDPELPGMRTWESFGGGVAILDFDNDGWPDVFFTQGGELSAATARTELADHLYRNLRNGRVQDVTNRAGILDSGYGQGTAVSDVNADGFPDLYIANIGQNRLLLNSGDGSFIDVTRQAGITAARWTTSCALADLNGDGLPEIYDVNYLAGNSPFERRCRDSEFNQPYACPPTVFDAEYDQLYLNLGDGRFQDVSQAAGVEVPNGKGLGIAAADLDSSGTLDLFIANDTTANFLFINQTPEGSDVPSLAEQAVLHGCAYDFEGRRQACMGIAVDDANGDGLLDMYVTNYYNEYNTLYMNQFGSLFIDATGVSGLVESSVRMLGFGTQFLDGNLDGWPDIVVANGHVDDFSWRGTPFRMRPQYYRALGDGEFSELLSPALGEFFEAEALGRSLARLDWNRDGREDFVVSHLDSPAALVENRTPNAGRFLALQLRGVESSRDAIGTTVRVTTGGRTRVRQLTAGDGYYASNQRQLIFGLGTNERIDELAVRWPSGLEQAFAEVPIDSELLLREGASRMLPIP